MPPRVDQLQPQPPPAPPSPPMAASRTCRTWLWNSLPSRGFNSIAGSLSVPRCHGCTVTQLVATIAIKISKMTQGCFMSAASVLLVLSRSRWAMQGLLGWAMAGCVGNGVGVPAPPEPGATGPKTWPEIQSQILEPTCAQPCHHGGAAPKGLALDTASAYKMLVGVASSEVPAMLRVAPGKPEDSYLMAKVIGSDPRRVGSRMPRTGPPFLSSAQITSLRHWISAGATTDWKDEPADAEVLTVPLPDAGGEPSEPGPSEPGPSEPGPDTQDGGGDMLQPTDLGGEN